MIRDKLEKHFPSCSPQSWPAWGPGAIIENGQIHQTLSLPSGNSHVSVVWRFAWWRRLVRHTQSSLLLTPTRRRRRRQGAHVSQSAQEEEEEEDDDDDDDDADDDDDDDDDQMQRVLGIMAMHSVRWPANAV